MSDDTSRVKARYCGNCGQKLMEDATFCAYCGSKVPSVASPPTAITSPTRTMPTYQTPYHPVKTQYEPALPFIQNFQGVLLSPQKEMSQISKRPNLTQPFLIVIISGILAGIAFYIALLPIDIQISDNFSDPTGMLDSGLYNIEEFIDLYRLILPLFSPISYLINWFILGLILWVLLSLISSNIASQERTFKIALTITGWSFLPRILNEIINVIANILFIEPQTVIVEDFYELSSLGVQSGLIWDILTLVDIIFLIWGSIIVYFAVKAIDLEGSHSILIAIIYTIIPIIISVLGFGLLS